MPNLRWLYWLITGGLMGFGLIGLLSIGLPFLFVGLAMLIGGLYWLGKGGFWAALIGFGLLPLFFLVRVFTVAPPACPTPPFTPPTGESGFICGSVHIPVSYYILVVVFAAIMLTGIAWPIVRQLHTRS